jgi:hypothetical protein
MSKFQELSESYFKYKAEETQYYDECFRFISNLKDLFLEYLDCDNTRISFFQPSTGLKDSQGPLFPDKIELYEDTFFHVGVALRFSADKSLPVQLVTFKWLVKKIDDEYIIKFNDSPIEFKASGVDDPKLIEFFDFILLMAKIILKISLRNF